MHGDQPAQGAPSDRERQRLALRAEQTRLLFAQTIPAQFISLGVAVIATVALWSVTDRFWLLAWFATVTLAISSRLTLVAAYRHAKPAPEQSAGWRRAHATLAAVAGLAWGMAGLLLAVTPSLPHQVFLILALGGVVTGAIGSNAPSLAAYLSFLVPALVPLAIQQLLQRDTAGMAYAVLVVLFGTVVAVTARNFYRSALTSLQLRYENLDLLNALSANHHNLLIANENQDALRRLLQLILHTTPLEQRLESALTIISSVSWLQLETKAALFLADGDGPTLRLAAASALTPAHRQQCAGVPFGQCLCGEAAVTRKIRFTTCADHPHHTPAPDPAPHSHYHVPIVSRGKLLGVLALYLHKDHKSNDAETRFLQDVADTLAGIIERCHADDELNLAASVFDNSVEGIMITDADGRILKVNPAFSRITGFSAPEVIGKSGRALRSELHDTSACDEAWKQVRQSGIWRGDVWNRRKNGEVFPVWQTIVAVTGSDRAERYIGIFDDISEEKRAEEHMRHLANHDALTGLPNRRLFEDRLNQAIERAKRRKKHVGVLFLDIDRFKSINDSLGYPAGDRLLQTCAERVRGAIRGEDTVARVGGDEFAVILEDLAAAHEAEPVAHKILAAISAPVRLSDSEVFPSATIGIGIYPDDGADTTALIKHADAALYQAEKQGQQQCRFYSAELSRAAAERLALETDLRHALVREELVLHYQPQVSVRGGRLTGTEALVRWRHPRLGMVSPARFIPLAEETKLILPLSEWVLRQAVRDWKQLTAGCAHKPRVSVNISSHQFQDASLVALVTDVLRETAVEARYLELEITESAFIHDFAAAARILHQLKALGVRIAIDDFGTGYSSLSYLTQLPIDTVKIDRAFVGRIDVEARDAALVNAIVDMCHTLNMEVVAEGVETTAQYARLQALGCDVIQGYLFGAPGPRDELVAMLERRWVAAPDPGTPQEASARAVNRGGPLGA